VRAMPAEGMTDQEVIIKVLKKNGLAESEIKPKIGECMDVMVKSFQKLIKGSSFKPLRGARKLLRKLSERRSYGTSIPILIY